MRNAESTAYETAGFDAPQVTIDTASMDKIDSRQVLWANVLALMQDRWGTSNINELARKAQVGPATVQRIKQQNTSVGLEVIDKIAAAFDVATWQLLVPGMQPKHMPTLLPVSDSERMFYERMLAAAKAFKQD